MYVLYCSIIKVHFTALKHISYLPSIHSSVHPSVSFSPFAGLGNRGSSQIRKAQTFLSLATLLSSCKGILRRSHVGKIVSLDSASITEPVVLGPKFECKTDTYRTKNNPFIGWAKRETKSTLRGGKNRGHERGLKQPNLFTGLVPAAEDVETTRTTYLEGAWWLLGEKRAWVRSTTGKQSSLLHSLTLQLS